MRIEKTSVPWFVVRLQRAFRRTARWLNTVLPRLDLTFDPAKYRTSQNHGDHVIVFSGKRVMIRRKVDQHPPWKLID